MRQDFGEHNEKVERAVTEYLLLQERRTNEMLSSKNKYPVTDRRGRPPSLGIAQISLVGLGIPDGHGRSDVTISKTKRCNVPHAGETWHVYTYSLGLLYPIDLI